MNIFGGNTNMSYEEIQRKRAIANAMVAQNNSAPKNVGEGLSAIGRAIAGRAIERRTGRQEEKLNNEWKEQVAGMGLDPNRAAIFGRMAPGMRDAAVLQHLNQKDAERRAAAARAASSGRASASAAEKERKAQATRMAIAQALQGQSVPTGAQMGPTVEAASMGANSGADLGVLQTEYQPPTQQSIVQALIGNPDVPMNMIDDVIDFLPEQPKPQYQQARGAELGLTGAQANAMFNVSPDGRVTQIGGGGTNVTVNNAGETVPKMGTIPQGYTVVPDPSNPAGFRMEAIPGGPEDTTANDLQNQTNRERSGSIVTEDIGRALEIVESDPMWTTGFGSVLAKVPGTEAKSLKGRLETIKANVGFDRLQQMRDASKTGGALGAINKTEMDLLQAVLGNLDQSLSAEDLAENLKRVNNIYLDIIHGPGQRPDAIPEQPTASGIPAPPEGYSPEEWRQVWDVMTEEDKALFR